MADFLGTRDSSVGFTTDNQSRLCLTLDTITLFDDTNGNFDVAEGNFDLGGTDSTSNPTNFNNNVRSTGEYTFANSISLDGIFDTTMSANVDMSTEDEYDLFDSGRGATLFENAKAPFDGSAEVQAGASILVGASNTSLGDVSSYTKIAQQKTIKGRYFKFKCQLTSANNKSKPKVNGLSFSVNFEKRTDSGEDIVSGTGTKTITFDNNFYATPSIGISAQGMATGDYYSITSKSKTGFTIQFFNASNNGISKTFDYQAFGYGLGT